uniref:Antizyme inhibitor 1a n=1 Tax=Sinocyclocheilus grahami TaxID=75366 RepID=A0A672K620_SINGR
MKGTLDEPRFSVELLEGSAALRGLIDKHIHDQTLALKSAFFVADLGVIVRQQVRWRAKMDQIRPFYTVKSNSSPVVVEILAALGTGFVCSNKHELDLVKGFGVPSQDIILGGTCKQLSHIKYAAKHNISLLVCDNEAELRKIARCHPKTNGEPSQEWPADQNYPKSTATTHPRDHKRPHNNIQRTAGLTSVKVSVHDSTIRKRLGKNGLHGRVPRQKPLLSKKNKGSSQFCVCPITSGVKDLEDLLFEHHLQSLKPSQASALVSRLLKLIMCNVVFCQEVSAEEPLFSSSLWGPSADDLDQVVKRCLLPELSVGDWLLFSNAGANGLGATFTNGEEHKPAVFYSITECDWYNATLSGILNPVLLFWFLIKLFFLLQATGS